jgi:hypothetical protein
MQIQAPDIDKLAAFLAARRDALAKLDEPVRRSLEALREEVQAAFDSGGAAVGAVWPPLAPRTLRDKLRLGYSPQPLVRTGRLRDGWTVRMEGPARGTLESVAPYARVHEEGLGRVPRRRFLPDPGDTRAIVGDAFREHVQEALSGEP